METLHIVDTLNRDNIIVESLKQQEVLINHRFMSFDQVFYETPNSLSRLLTAIDVTKQHLDDFQLLKPALHYPENIKQAIHFLDLCDRYQLDLKSLPTGATLLQEKTKLIHLLADTIQRPYQQWRKDLTNDIVVHPFYQELYHQTILNHIKHQKIELPNTKNQHIIYKKALNPRQEVSGLLHYILENKLKNVTIYIGNRDYIQELKRQFVLFPQLQLSFQESQLDPVLVAFYHLVKAYHQQDRASLINFFKLNLFHDSEMMDYLQVVELMNLDFDTMTQVLPDIDYDFETLLPHQLAHQKQIYQQARELSHLIQQRLGQIDASHLIESIFNLFTTLPHQNVSLYALKQVLEENYALMTQDNLLFVLEQSCLKPKIQINPITPIQILDFKTPQVSQPEVTFILGACQQNFPNFSKASGLYNEDYLSKVPHFPSLQERISFHTQQLFNHFSSASQLVISYPLMDYQGKPFQTSFELEQHFQLSEASPWEFTEEAGRPSKISNLSKSMAKKLFSHQGMVIGSVTSLELFTKNSFQYFIEKGLQLKKPSLFDLDVASIGTLSHHVMEVLVKTYQKGYTQVAFNEIKALLQPTFNQLSQLYPQRQAHYALSLNRLTNVLAENIKQLQDYEDKAQFQPDPLKLELRFNQEKLFPEVPLKLNGIIDRLDTNEEGFIVIDYKSSDKRLNMTDIKNGRQLQLLTYALMGERILKQTCLGAYYISLHLKLETKPRFKLSSKELILKPTVLPTKLLEGKGFKPSLSRYLYGPRMKLYDLEVIHPYFNKLFKKITEDILNGILTNFVNLDEYFYFNDLQRNKETYSNIDELYLEIDDQINFTMGAAND